MVKPPEFTRQSACKDAGDKHDDLLFPGRPPSEKKLARVRLQFCNGCAVQEQCRQLGESSGSEGIWGGDWFKGNATVRDEALKREVIERVRDGETDSSISRMTGVDRSAVSTWRRAEGLPPNVPFGATLERTA